MQDCCCEGLEKRRLIDHFDGRDLRRTEGDVFCFELEPAQVRPSFADGHSTEFRFPIAVSEIGCL